MSDNFPKFLSFFNYSLLTVSLLPDKDEEVGYLEQGKYFSPKNRIRAVTLETFKSSDFQQEILSAQAKNFGVFFMPNEGNGIGKDLESGNLNCGRRVNVTTLKALFIDTDDANADDLLAHLTTINFLPHIVVESSPKKFHFYFLINPVPAEGENIIKWEALQKHFDDFVPNLDQSMAQTNQVLRLPGYYHLKGLPNKVKVTQVNKSDPYDLNFLFDRFKLYLTLKEQVTPSDISADGKTITAQTKQYNKFEFPLEPHSLQKGNRRQTISRYIEHTLENILPLSASDAEYFTLIDAFIIRNLPSEDTQSFLSGERRNNIVQYFKDAKQYRLKKQNALLAAIAEKKLDKEIEKHQTELPDDFYLSFPGDLGFLVNEIHNYCPKMSLEMAFAGALTISGALKADSFRYKGSWPLVNGIIIAGTGSFKSTLKAILQEIFYAAGFTGQYSQLIDFQNTVQSLHEKLYSAGGVGTTLIDESGDYLQQLAAKNAPGYVKALRKYFKEATTGRGHGTRLTPGGSMSFTVPAIRYGMLSIWIFIQPGMFEKSLSIDDVGDGFIPRFLVFNGRSSYDLLSTYKQEKEYAPFEPSLDLKVFIESLLAKSSFQSAQSLSGALADAETAATQGTKKAKRYDIAVAQRDAVYELRQEARLRLEKVEVKLTEDAQSAVICYLQERQQEALKLVSSDSDSPALDFYIRIEEMLNRLLCNASPLSGLVDLALAERCIRIHSFKTDSFFRTELPALSETTFDKDKATVLQGLERACKKEKGAVIYKQLQTAIAGRNRPQNLNMVLKSLIETGVVWKTERPHLKLKDKTVSCYVPAPSEDPLD